MLRVTGKSDYQPPVRSPHSIALIRNVVVTDFSDCPQSATIEVTVVNLGCLTAVDVPVRVDNSTGDPPSFFTGIAVNPAVDDIEHEADRLKRKIDNGAHFAMTQVFFEWAPWERFLELFGGQLPIPVLVAVWPVRSLKMALRLHHEVPGIDVPENLLSAMEAAGPDAAKVGRERALTLFREAPKYADGVYLIAPFKKPENVIPLIDEAMG